MRNYGDKIEYADSIEHHLASPQLNCIDPACTRLASQRYAFTPLAWAGALLAFRMTVTTHLINKLYGLILCSA